MLQGSKDKQKCSWRQEGEPELAWAKSSAFALLNLRHWMMSTEHLETLTESQMVRLLVPRTKAGCSESQKGSQKGSKESSRAGLGRPQW